MKWRGRVRRGKCRLCGQWAARCACVRPGATVSVFAVCLLCVVVCCRTLQWAVRCVCVRLGATVSMLQGVAVG